MSGIVGLVNLDGRVVEQELFQHLTNFLAFRGPDARQVWSEGPAGLGHALLQTTLDTPQDRQPCSLDGQVWITADARIDGRKELLQKLEGQGCVLSGTPTDAELILHAYRIWGEDCVQHLLGDFAFAVWDGPRRRLVCARDPFGIKPFYYTPLADSLIVSNTLDCIRAHPLVSDRLNEQAIGDFLLFGYNHDPATTFFADIQRLPPAHTLTWSGGRLRVQRYWSLPVDQRLEYQRKTDYVDHFREVLRTAVADRLRTDRVGVFMSGGLDSTAVAAAARQSLTQQSAPFDLRAYTLVYDRLIPDEERHYSGLAASTLGLPIHYLTADHCRPFDGWDRETWHTPEPIEEPLAASFFDQLEQVKPHSRVVLTGHGGDAVFFPTPFYLLDLLRTFRWGRWFVEVGRYLLSHGKLPPLGFRNLIRQWRRPQGSQDPFPDWLNPDFANRLCLRTHWEEQGKKQFLLHPTHPAAYDRLRAVFWTNLFESLDPGMTRCAVEFRQPLFDVRLVNYVLSIPPLPWCVDKELLRESLRGILPESVRRRRKTLLAGDPLVEILRQGTEEWKQRRGVLSHVAAYVNPERVQASIESSGQVDSGDPYSVVRPFCLAYWFQSGARKARPNRRENCHAIV